MAGLLAGFVSLHLVQSAVSTRWSQAWGWLIAVVVLGLSGFGVYLGRFARYNSWDVLTRPRALVYDVGSSVGPSGGGRAVLVTALRRLGGQMDMSRRDVFDSAAFDVRVEQTDAGFVAMLAPAPKAG